MNSGILKVNKNVVYRCIILIIFRLHETIILVKNMEYTRILKQMRTEKKLTQNDIANILKITRGLYSQYEIADKIIPLSHLNALSNYFNLSLDYLLGLSTVKNYKHEKKEIDINLFQIRLKQLRKENKLTQEKLAIILNTSHSVISAYENGKNLILTSFLYSICQHFSISADYLLGKTDEKNLDKKK